MKPGLARTATGAGLFWQRIFLIWMQPILMQKNIARKTTLLLAFGFLPLLGVVLYFVVPDAKFKPVEKKLLLLIGGFAINFVMLIAVWILRLPLSYSMQFSAANARLLPHQKRHLQWAIAIPILALSVVAGLLLAITITWSIFAPAWLLTIFFMSAYIACLRTPLFGLLLLLLIVLPMGYIDQAIALFEILKSRAHPLVLIGLGLSALWLALRWLFTKGEHLLTRKQFKAEAEGVAKFYSPFSTLLVKRLKRLCERPPQPALYEKLLPYALGPKLDWPLVALHFGMVGIVYVSANFLIAASSSLSAAVPSTVSMMMATLTYSYYRVAHNAVYQSRAACALMQLAMRAPKASLQWRFMLRQILMYYFVAWLTATIVCVLYGQLFIASPGNQRLAYLMSACLLVPIIYLVKDYASMKSAKDDQIAFTVMMTLSVFVTSLLIAYFTPVPTWVLCTVIVSGVALTLRSRWRALMRIGPMFPTGRAV